MSRFRCLAGYTVILQHTSSQQKCNIFRVFLLHTSSRVLNHLMVGLLINPVSWLITQQPGPIKMRQVTRYHWSYIHNYNRIHY